MKLIKIASVASTAILSMMLVATPLAARPIHSGHVSRSRAHVTHGKQVCKWERHHGKRVKVCRRVRR